jgi:predicted RND superfamily exporter protein
MTLNRTPHLINAWCSWVARNQSVIHLSLLALCFFSVFTLAKNPINPDWLALFKPDDQVLMDYHRYVDDQENMRTLYLRCIPKNKTAASEIPRKINDFVNPDTTIRTLPSHAEDAREKTLWLTMKLVEVPTSQDVRNLTTEIEHGLDSMVNDVQITGAAKILAEFQDSVNRDFIRISIVSFALIPIVLVLAFGFSTTLFWAFFYEISALLIATAVCVSIFGPLNILSATLPCVLLGLGADYIIHCLAANTKGSGGEETGFHIYQRVGIPMLLGALTTAIAFFSMAFADLEGLRQAGILGGLGVLTMFALIILLLPARIHGNKKKVSPPLARKPPTRLIRGILKSRAAAMAFTGICLVAATGIPRIETEHDIEKLYDPDMPSLKLQNNLAHSLDAYPSLLTLHISTDSPEKMLAHFTQSDPPPPFTIVGKPAATSKEMTGTGSLTLQIYSTENPFSPANFNALERAVKKELASFPESTFTLVGDASLGIHMNNLLERGMLRALPAVFLTLAVLLLAWLRHPLAVASPLLCLALAIAAALGTMGWTNIRLSVYTLTLIPLFVGIGIDDLLYVTHAQKSGVALEQNRPLLKAISLTTLTTILGYGSLTTAGNNGFVAMGKTAVLGLTLMYLTAILVLPRSQRTDSK